MAKAISPAALVALKEALTSLYWYKSDLRSFLSASVSNPALLSRWACPALTDTFIMLPESRSGPAVLLRKLRA